MLLYVRPAALRSRRVDVSFEVRKVEEYRARVGRAGVVFSIHFPFTWSSSTFAMSVGIASA